MMMSFTFFCCEVERNNERLRNGLSIGMECRREISDSYGQESEEWEEAQAIYGQLKEELDCKIGLSIGFEGFMNKLQEWGK